MHYGGGFCSIHAVLFQLDLQVLLGQNPKCSSEAASSQTRICSVSSTTHLINKKINQQIKEKSQNIFEVLNGSCSESLFILMNFLCGLGRTTSQPQLPAVTHYKYRQSREGAGCESRRQRMPKETNPQNGTQHRQETGRLNLGKYGMAMGSPGSHLEVQSVLRESSGWSLTQLI